ncbi:MAG: hypothetical protein ABI114_10780 [Rhodanobacter sp.]
MRWFAWREACWWPVSPTTDAMALVINGWLLAGLVLTVRHRC